MDRELLAAQSGGKLLPELCSLLENDSNEGTPHDFDASFWKRGRENVFLQMFQFGENESTPQLINGNKVVRAVPWMFVRDVRLSFLLKVFFLDLRVFIKE